MNKRHNKSGSKRDNRGRRDRQDQKDRPAASPAGKSGYGGPLKQIDDYIWQIPKDTKLGMRVEGRIFADKRLLRHICADQAPEQVINVAHLPGIQVASFAMPDIHWGYGFCIGGVAATDPAEGGVISPGGVGYDINCGVRLVRTNLSRKEIQPRIVQLTDALFRRIPAGVGRGGSYLFEGEELKRLLADGSQFLKTKGLATDNDIDHTEARGRLDDAVPDQVSQRAMARGGDQCGTLGSGNHFVEIQVVDEILDQEAARIMGIEKDQICVMIHSGSRGLGYQVCDDSLKQLRNAPAKYGIELPDRQLACAPIESPEGQAYLGAMGAAANYAWANRQLLMWEVRAVFAEFFGRSWESLQMGLVYDVAHNIAKMERHTVEGREKLLCVHRKGATRAFPAGHPEVPEQYRSIGQPVIIPGDMGRASWILVGGPGSMEKSFGSSCHGAGRLMSRKAAIRHAQGRRIDRELAEKGIIVRCRNWKGLAEEQPEAYKDVSQVVDVVDRAGLAKKVARLRPMGVVKG